jgi:hypothetical protein
VIGVLTITSPAAPPFRKVCETCYQVDIISSANKDSYCNVCRAKKTSIKSAFVRGTIVTDENWSVFVNIDGRWLEALIHETTDQFLASSRFEQIKLLKSIRIRGTFLLSTTSHLVGFQEQFQFHQYSSSPSRFQVLDTIEYPESESTLPKVDLQISPLASKFDEEAPSSSKRKLFEELAPSSKLKKS